ncbi:MAG TPA: hypothetical protein VHA56_09495 [Mucilaginibacter sp.]|nr:hypothetical protein [Mucilaginibacter sp.]
MFSKSENINKNHQFHVLILKAMPTFKIPAYAFSGRGILMLANVINRPGDNSEYKDYRSVCEMLKNAKTLQHNLTNETCLCVNPKTDWPLILSY